MDFGEGSSRNAGWPDPVSWFTGNNDFSNIATGLMNFGFKAEDVGKIMGLNWLLFFESSFKSQ